MTAEEQLAWCWQHHVDLHFSVLGTVILFYPGLPWIEGRSLELVIRRAQEMLAVEGALATLEQVLLLKEAS